MVSMTRHVYRAKKLFQLIIHNLKTSQKTQKLGKDERLSFQPKHAPGDYAVVYRPPLEPSTGEYLATDIYFKLMPLRHGQCQLVSTGPKTDKVWQGGVENKLGIGRVSKAPLSFELQ